MEERKPLENVKTDDTAKKKKIKLTFKKQLFYTFLIFNLFIFYSGVFYKMEQKSSLKEI